MRALQGPLATSEPDGRFLSERAPVARAGASAAGLRGPEARSPRGAGFRPCPGAAGGAAPGSPCRGAGGGDQRRPWAAGRGALAPQSAFQTPRLTFPGAGQDSALAAEGLRPTPGADRREQACPPSSYWPRNPSACSRLRVLSHRLRGTTAHTAVGVRCPEGLCALACRLCGLAPDRPCFPSAPDLPPLPSPSCSLRRTCRYWLSLVEAPLPPCPASAPSVPWKSCQGSLGPS